MNPFTTNSTFVNAKSINSPAMFGSNQRPTSCMRGGGYKRKNSLTPIYNSMGRFKKRTGRKNARGTKRTRRTRAKRLSRSFKGGYSQFQSNYPNTPSYSVAGTMLNAGNSALATPPPISARAGGCIDNYSRFTNTGFPSRGH